MRDEALDINHFFMVIKVSWQYGGDGYLEINVLLSACHVLFIFLKGYYDLIYISFIIIIIHLFSNL